MLSISALKRITRAGVAVTAVLAGCGEATGVGIGPHNLTSGPVLDFRPSW